MKHKNLFFAAVFSLFAGVSVQAQNGSGQMDEHFNDSIKPYGWFTEGWIFKSGAAQSSSGSTFDITSMTGGAKSRYLLTPPLKVAAGDSLAFNVKKGGMSFSSGSDSLIVEESVYGSGKWETVAVFKDTLTSSYRPLAIRDVAAGEWRFRFTTSSSLSLDSVAGHTIDMNAPDLYVTLDSAVVSEVTFGHNVRKDTTRTFIVMNTGTGTLDLNVTSSDEKLFTLSTKQLSIASGDSATLSVTFKYIPDSIGRHLADLTFTPSDKRVAAQTISLNANIIDPDMWYVDFNDSIMPYGFFAEGWIVKNGVATKGSSNSSGFDMSSLMGGGGGTNFLMTPPLTVQEGESLVFSACKAKDSGMGSMMGSSDSTFVVEYEVYSEHRWKKLADFTTQLDSVYKDFTISGVAPGEYRFRFKAGGNVNIDSIAGFHIDMEAPDIYVLRDSVAATNVNFGLCTKDSTTTFIVINTATGTLNVDTETYEDMPYRLSAKQLAVAAGDSVAVDFTYIYKEAKQGRNTTEISFKPTDSRVFGVDYRADAIVAETGVWQETFNASTKPAGWFTEGWQFKDSTVSIIKPSDGMEGMMGGSSPLYYVLTPALTIESPLQVLSFSAKTTGSSGMGSMFGGGGSTFSVEKAVYGTNRWEKVKDFSNEVDTVFTTLWVSELKPGDYRFRFVATDSIVIDSVAGFALKENAPDLYVTVDSVAASQINLGMVREESTKTIMVINTGNGTLNVNVSSTNNRCFTISQSELSIAAGDTAKVDVTFTNNVFAKGEVNSVITFTPTNDGLKPTAVLVSAYTISDNTWSEDFEPEYIVEDETQPLALPAGWETTGWTISKPSGGDMMALFGGGGSGEEKSWMATTESEDYELITPRLQAGKGDIMQFLADMSGGGMMAMFGMGGGAGRLDVYYSREDYDDWTYYGTYTQTGMVTFKAPFAGIYRLKFKGSAVSLDDFKGFQQPLRSSIALVDGMDEQNQEVLELFDRKKVNVSYDRVLAAEANKDGTWTPKAHTICLPYDLDFNDYYESGKVKLYRLQYVDRYYHHFIFKEANDKASAGAAYLAVVNNESVKLNAYNVEVTDQIITYSDMAPTVFDYETWRFNHHNEIIGMWQGSFGKCAATDEKANLIYALTDDGSWVRLSIASSALPGFRGYFYAETDTLSDDFQPSQARASMPAVNQNGKEVSSYQTKFYQNEDNKEDETPILLFSGDITIDGSNTTGIRPTIETIDADGTRRYFDMQGRLLNAKPQKGFYIERSASGRSKARMSK